MSQDRVYAPHSFEPWRLKDFDFCNVCSLPRHKHEQMYEPNVTATLCNEPIEGFDDTVCDKPKNHKEYDNPSEHTCSGIRGNA